MSFWDGGDLSNEGDEFSQDGVSCLRIWADLSQDQGQVVIGRVAYWLSHLVFDSCVIVIFLF